VIATGAYNYILGHQNFRQTLEKRLRQFGTDYIDVYMLLGAIKPEHFSESMREEFNRFRAEGKIGNVGLSTHNRKFAGELAAKNAVDVMMVRYNAAHRGAEQEIFPNVKPNNPGIISYTATRWRYLLRRPPAWKKGERIPTAGMCYRFVLSNPAVDVCLTAPSNLKQLEENLAAFKEGPLAADDMAFMHKFGDAVHA
jgi:aryl-alcohol dehydrogenase-like predicted oxidoreductase